MRIPSGKIDILIYFVALDSSDRVTRKTGLSSFTVYRSRNGGTATVYTTPTVTELSSSNMPGVYSLTIDEDTTIASGSDSEEYCVHITCATMAPVSRTIELYRRDTTSGRTLDVSSGGEAGLDWANIGSPTTAVNLSATNIDVDQVVASVSGAVGSVAGAVGSVTGLTASNLDTTVSSRMATYAQPAGFLAATFPSDPADQSLIIAATDALASLIGDVPTNAELATALAGADDATLSAIAALNNISAAQVNAEVDTALADYDGPTHAEMTAEFASADDAILAQIALVAAKTDNLPSDPADASVVAGLIAAVETKVDDLPTNAELATALGTADDAVLVAIAALPAAAEVTAIKAKTDQMVFSKTGELDTNIHSVNDVTVVGDGGATTWGP